MKDDINEKILFNVRDVLEDINSNILWNYITNLQEQLHQASLDIQELTNLQQEIKEANDSITWWTNRFKAVERDNRELKEELEKEKRIEEADLKTIQRLEEENERIEKEYKSKVDDIGKLTSKIYKAIEYINHAQNYGTMAQVMPHLKPYVNGDDLLNILQNGSDSQ